MTCAFSGVPIAKALPGRRVDLFRGVPADEISRAQTPADSQGHDQAREKHRRRHRDHRGVQRQEPAAFRAASGGGLRKVVITFGATQSSTATTPEELAPEVWRAQHRRPHQRPEYATRDQIEKDRPDRHACHVEP